MVQEQIYRRIRKSGTWRALVLSTALLLAPAGHSAAQEEVAFSLGGIDFLGSTASFVDVSAGVFNVHDRDEGFLGDASAMGKLEWRYGGKVWIFGPVLGVLANNDGGVLGYGGIYADLRLGDFLVTPQFAISAYERGDGPDLGGVLEFRSAVTVSYRFDNGIRLGIGGSHISNARIHDRNPGTEEIYISVAFPLSSQ